MPRGLGYPNGVKLVPVRLLLDTFSYFLVLCAKYLPV